MKSTRWVVTYILMASVGLWFAFFLSLKFVTPARAQNAPPLPPPGQGGPPPPPPVAQTQPARPAVAQPNLPLPPGAPPAPTAADLPPEFIEQGGAPGVGPAPGQIPPPPAGTPVARPQAQQPPGQAPPSANPAVDQGAVPVPLPVPAPVNPEFAGDEQYTYEPGNRRDPFKPYRNYRPAPTGPGTGAGRADLSDPLQRWDVMRFSVMAIIWEVRSPKAMIKDPEGTTYMIGKNTKIGRNGGYVVAIREGEVVIVETIDTEGVVTKEVKILELKK